MSKAKLLVLLLLSGYTMVSYGDCVPGSRNLDQGTTDIQIINNTSGTLYYGGENSGGTIKFTDWSGSSPTLYINMGAGARMLFCANNYSSGADITLKAPEGTSIGTISFKTTYDRMKGSLAPDTTCSTNIANSACVKVSRGPTDGNALYCECTIKNP